MYHFGRIFPIFGRAKSQKVAISRAFYKDAEILIMDEPSSALDPIAEADIYSRFNTTLAGGKTAIYISHRLSSCQFCDRIAVFSDGIVKEYGTHEELVNLKDGLYAEMFVALSFFFFPLSVRGNTHILFSVCIFASYSETSDFCPLL